MQCPAKHTKYQPADEEWRCPKCSATSAEGWTIYDQDGTQIDGCEKLHNADLLYCEQCSHSETGQVFASRIARQKQLIPCPHCKGTGLLKGGKE